MTNKELQNTLKHYPENLEIGVFDNEKEIIIFAKRIERENTHIGNYGFLFCGYKDEENKFHRNNEDMLVFKTSTIK